LAMADRRGLLARIVRVLQGGGADGLLASLDVLEDLFILDALCLERGAPSFLDGRVLLASLNRGGLAGSVWGLDDPMTGPTPQACVAWNLDGAKALLRICLSDPGTRRTLEACADAARALLALDMPFFLEPLPMRATDDGLALMGEAGPLAQAVGVAAALGDGGQGLWLKLPYCDDFSVVAGATTLPIVLLGGPRKANPVGFLAEIRAGLDAGPNVRGALLGRNVLYPAGHDPLSVARAVAALVHQGATVEAATAALEGDPPGGLLAIRRWFKEVP